MHRGFINILFNLLYQFTDLFVRLLCVQLQEGNYGLINSLSPVSSYWVNTRKGQTHALGSLSLVSVPARVETHKRVQHILLLSKSGMSNLQPEGKILLKSNRWYDTNASTGKLFAKAWLGFMYWSLYKKAIFIWNAFSLTMRDIDCQNKMGLKSTQPYCDYDLLRYDTELFGR